MQPQKNFRSSLIVATVIFGLGTACTDTHQIISGQFAGSIDGKPDTAITLRAGTTGDFFTNGIWESNTAFKTGELSTRKNYFGDLSYTLSIKEGTCQGDFPLQLKLAGNKLMGNIQTGVQCAEDKTHFTLSAVSAKL